MEPLANTALLYFRCKLDSPKKEDFIVWQGRLHESVSLAAGFLSLEIVTEANGSDIWLMTLRFDSTADCLKWQSASAYQMLMAQLQAFLAPNSILKVASNPDDFGEGFHSKV